MRYVIFIFKIVLLFILLMFYTLSLAQLKETLMNLGCSPMRNSVMWMGSPMLFVSCLILFVKTKIPYTSFFSDLLGRFNFVVEKIIADLPIIGFLIKIVTYILFLVPTFYASFFMIFGFDCAITQYNVFLGIPLFIIGLLLAIFSNSFFKTN